MPGAWKLPRLLEGLRGSRASEPTQVSQPCPSPHLVGLPSTHPASQPVSSLCWPTMVHHSRACMQLKPQPSQHLPLCLHRAGTASRLPCPPASAALQPRLRCLRHQLRRLALLSLHLQVKAAWLEENVTLLRLLLCSWLSAAGGTGAGPASGMLRLGFGWGSKAQQDGRRSRLHEEIRSPALHANGTHAVLPANPARATLPTCWWASIERRKGGRADREGGLQLGRGKVAYGAEPGCVHRCRSYPHSHPPALAASAGRAALTRAQAQQQQQREAPTPSCTALAWRRRQYLFRWHQVVL